MARKKTESWSDTSDRSEKNTSHLNGMATAEPIRLAAPITLPTLELQTCSVRIISDSPLICHRFSEKMARMMLDKQMGVASPGREKKDPEQDFLDSLYPHPEGGYGFPAIAFKCAAVDACTSLGKSVTKVQARQSFHVVGELVKIEGEPKKRQDMVRLNGQTADVRFRAEFTKWSTELTLRYNARVLTPQQIINMINTAGFAVGIGEWRPEKNGSYGMFHVAGKGE